MSAAGAVFLVRYYINRLDNSIRVLAAVGVLGIGTGTIIAAAGFAGPTGLRPAGLTGQSD